MKKRWKLMGYRAFENAKLVAFDINGTLIDGEYRSWEWVFEMGLGLRRREKASPLRWYDVQTGRLSFEDAVSLTYDVEDPTNLRDEAFRVYLAKLTLRKGCEELLEALCEEYDLVICSDTSGVTKVIIESFGLKNYFQRSFYSIDTGWLKSDREFWAIFLSSFPCRRPEEMIMIGDNPRCDTHWPNILGIGTVQIETTEILSEENLRVFDAYDRPDLYVRSLEELTGFLIP